MTEVHGIVEQFSPHGLPPGSADINSNPTFTDRELAPLLWFTLESAVDEVYWLNVSGTIRFVNKRAARSLGWPRDELNGMHISDIQEEMPPEKALPLNRSLVNTEGEEVFEAVHRRRNGSRYPVSVHRRVFPGTGDLQYLLFCRDTTHRHEFVWRIKEAAAEKTMILNAIHENLVLYDRDFHILWCNDDPAEWFGLSPDALPGRICYEILYNRTTPCEGCTVRQVIEGGVPITEEKRLGNGRFVKTSVYPVHDAGGEVIGAVESCLDISKRKSAEQRYMELFSTMQNGFVVFALEERNGTDDLVFLEANPAYEALSGLLVHELIGNSCRTLFPEGRDAIISRYAAVARTGAPAVFEDYNPIFRRHFRIQAYAPKRGQVAALYTDITEVVNLNEQKKQSLIQIERNFEQLAILNDEIRNPLQVIIGLSILSPAEESEKILEQASTINRLVNTLDQRWLESEKIRDFLRKHYDYT